MLDRRQFIAAAAATIAAPHIVRASGPLTLWGPPASPSLLLVRAAADARLKALAPAIEVKIWRTPDEMRAGISSGGMEAVVVPSYVAANLRNRGLGIRLANILTHGMLYVVAPTGSVAGIAGLKGKRVALPFRNDMPDFVFRRLLASAKLSGADMTIDYSGTPPEAVQLLLTGRVDAALLSEPAASAVVLLSGLAGKPMERAVDTRVAWTEASGRKTLPQAGLALTDALAKRIGSEGVNLLQRALEDAVAAVLANPSDAAQEASPLLGLPAPVLERAVPSSHLVAQPASAARPDLIALFEALAAEDPRIIGGKLPDEGFYAL